MQSRIKSVGGLLAALILGAFCQMPGQATAAEVDAAPAMSIASVPAVAGVHSLTMTRPDGTVAHAFPTVSRYAKMLAASPRDTGPLVYHSGGVIMPYVHIYTIYWAPPKLQNGTATSIPASYMNILNTLAREYPEHGIDNNSTQYYQIAGSPAVKTYITTFGTYAGTYTDTSAYPASHCDDQVTGTNCIDDADIQAEVKKVLNLKGWVGGLGNIYVVFTAPNEGSCFAANDTPGNCAFTGYCAYHSHISGTTPVVYANEPYSILADCQNPGQPSPNNNAVADTQTSTTSHEITEAITDPEGNAWFTAGGSEIGDLCAYNYGTNSWDSNKANEMWGGYFFELQMEFDNHQFSPQGTCEQVGP